MVRENGVITFPSHVTKKMRGIDAEVDDKIKLFRKIRQQQQQLELCL